MILTDYYTFRHLPESKSKMRFDCVASTQSYPEFEGLRNKAGSLFVYYGNVPDNFKASAKRRADKAITKSKNISSVFVPDLELPLAYGDINGTLDAIMLRFTPDYNQFEVFVARGQRNNQSNLYLLFADGGLQTEIELLQKRLVTEMVTPKE